jgi:hypothetical protein
MIRKFHFTKRRLEMGPKLFHAFDHELRLYQIIKNYNRSVSVFLEHETEYFNSDLFIKASS